MEWTRDPGSFRDPSGFVFRYHGVLYRTVHSSFAAPFRRLIDSGLYEELVHAGLLVAHEAVDLDIPDFPDALAVLKPTPIPFISYPYEWCFGQYKAAALLTLDLQMRALERGMVLRDASAYNVQFAGGRPIFIDTLSFGDYVEGEPWSAYRQFCQHFLTPLALMALVHPTLGLLSRVHIDGIPLDVAAKLLPVTSCLRPGLLTHLHLHGRSVASGPQLHVGASPRRSGRRMGKAGMLGLVDSLKRTVQGLGWDQPATLWSTYMDHANYSDAAHAHKQRLVRQWLDLIRDRSRLDTVWDLGANVGTYSQIAAERASLVVSLDFDHAAVESLFRASRERTDDRILPLVQDLANPSGAIGWHHRERRSLADRGPADVGLALALVHHLALGHNVPLPAVAAFLHEICRHLIIEFVPKDDSQVQRMLALREEVFADYTEPRFEAAFAAHFEILQAVTIPETVRRLYLMRALDPAV